MSDGAVGRSRTAFLASAAVTVLALAIPASGGSPDAEAAAASRRGGRLALTFDDLPWGDPDLPADAALAATDRLLAALAVAGAPAAGFVVCDRIAGREAVLERWLATGHELGNHSAAHRDIDRTDLPLWLDDVRRCHRSLARRTASRYFRFPLLHQGATRERHEAAQVLLRDLGERIAQVTVDNSEWILAARYRRAHVAGDGPRQSELGRLLVSHLVAAVEHFRDVARRRFGRDVDHVVLLHANLLVAEHLPEVLAALAERGACFIPLALALDDPIYARPDGYVGRKGLSWLYRVAPAVPAEVAWDDREAGELTAAAGR